MQIFEMNREYGLIAKGSSNRYRRRGLVLFISNPYSLHVNVVTAREKRNRALSSLQANIYTVEDKSI